MDENSFKPFESLPSYCPPNNAQNPNGKYHRLAEAPIDVTDSEEI